MLFWLYISIYVNCHVVLFCLVFSSLSMSHLRTWVVLYSDHNPLQSGALDGPRRQQSGSQSWVFMPFTKWIVSPSSQDEHQVLEMPPLQMHPGALSSVMSHHPDRLQSNINNPDEGSENNVLAARCQIKSTQLPVWRGCRICRLLSAGSTPLDVLVMCDESVGL